MKCETCGTPMRFKVSLYLDCSAHVFHRLSKKNLRTSLVTVEGADWPRSHWYCPRAYKHPVAK